SAWPETRSTPIVVRTAALAMSEPIITRRRGTRSPTTPPTASVATVASVHAAKLSPTAVAPPPLSRIANATAIGARYVPTYEIARAAKRRRNARRRSGPAMALDADALRLGRQACGPFLGPALESGIRLPERHCEVVGRQVLAGVGELRVGVLDEPLLRRAALDRLGPVEEVQPQLRDVAADIVDDAEVD